MVILTQTPWKWLACSWPKQYDRTYMSNNLKAWANNFEKWGRANERTNAELRNSERGAAYYPRYSRRHENLLRDHYGISQMAHYKTRLFYIFHRLFHSQFSLTHPTTKEGSVKIETTRLITPFENWFYLHLELKFSKLAKYRYIKLVGEQLGGRVEKKGGMMG